MFLKPLEPSKLVKETGAGCGIAIRKIKASDEHAVGLPLDIATMEIVRIARQVAANLDRISAARKNRDAIEALLAVPHDPVACLANSGLGKFVMRELEFLKAFLQTVVESFSGNCQLLSPGMKNLLRRAI